MFTCPTIVKKPKGKNILVLAPHMDDEIIGCGGVICKHIQNGDSVAVVYFTRGFYLVKLRTSVNCGFRRFC